MDFAEQLEFIKIVIVGNYGVGKSSIALRYSKNQYSEEQKNTVGVQFLSKHLKVRNKNFKLSIWDTAGQERFRTLSSVYFKGAHGVIIVYDITNPFSYKEVKDWLAAARQNLNRNQFVTMVVGNKNDRDEEKQIAFDTVLKEYKQNQNIDCWEVSAKNGQNINEMFSSLAQSICDMLYGKQKIEAKKVSAEKNISKEKEEKKERSENVSESMSENKKTIKELTKKVEEQQISEKQLQARIQIQAEYIAQLKELINSRKKEEKKVEQTKY